LPLLRIVGYKRLTAFSAAFFLGLLTANLAFALIVDPGQVLDLVLRGGEKEGVAILNRDSRSIYTSRIPASLALSLGKLPNTQVESLIASICYVQGSAIVVRGIESTAPYATRLSRGRLPKSDGPWIILGRKTADRIRAQIDQVIPIASSLARTVALLTVAAVCDFNDMRDDEALVHEGMARQLSSIPSGMISAAIVQGTSREAIEKLIETNYKLNIKCGSDLPGNLVVLEANGVPLRTSKVDGKLEETYELPFGYYTVVYQDQYLSSTLGTVLLKSDQSLSYSMGIEQRPVLKVSAPRKPVLLRWDGVEVQASQEEGLWVFRSIPGVHRLEFDSVSFTIPLFHSATFDSTILSGKTYATSLSVSWSDGNPASDYSLLVRTPEGKVILSILAPQDNVKIDLPEGNYVVEAYKLPYSAQIPLSVPAMSDAKLILPSIKSNVEKIPLQYYTLIKAMPIETVSAFTLASISGISAALLLGLTFSIMFLFVMVLATVQRYLYLSAKSRLTVLSLLGASKGFFLRHIELPILAIGLALATATASISLVTNTFLFSTLTLFGHTIPHNPAMTLLFSATLTILVWLWGHFTLPQNIEG
jgi:hypothetical protein